MYVISFSLFSISNLNNVLYPLPLKCHWKNLPTSLCNSHHTIMPHWQQHSYLTAPITSIDTLLQLRDIKHNKIIPTPNNKHLLCSLSFFHKCFFGFSWMITCCPLFFFLRLVLSEFGFLGNKKALLFFLIDGWCQGCHSGLSKLEQLRKARDCENDFGALRLIKTENKRRQEMRCDLLVPFFILIDKNN